MRLLFSLFCLLVPLGLMAQPQPTGPFTSGPYAELKKAVAKDYSYLKHSTSTIIGIPNSRFTKEKPLSVWQPSCAKSVLR